ncbi:MAG: TonB-dependent receptor [Prevotella sp.]|nr:TonB-dependent receptor [Prevotella sp.]MCM1074746.1 TonB-dependent receptor [Ruminococcus sp.]
MKKIFLTAAALSIAAVCFAKGTVTGFIKNKATGEPIDFANVQLYDAKTGKALPIGATADIDGKFVIQDVPDGRYMLKATNIGSLAQERPVTVKGGQVNVGDISLADDTKMLEEVVVTGQASTMKFELDKKVFTVGNDITTAGASASELLESIPSVEVDQDGEVSLRGNSSVTVWINGKESGLTADNRAQILEQIPGETIEKIEVITNPSAKFSPEGTAGIINIVLKKDRRAGYFGSAEIGANTRGGGNASFNINYNAGKFDSYASVGFRMRHNKGGSYSHRDYENGEYLYSDGESRNHGNNLFLRLGTTYHFTDKDDLYANAFGMLGHRWGKSTTLYNSNLPGQWLHNENLSRNSNDMRGGHLELGYTHRFSDNHTLDAMVGYNYWGGPMWNSYFQHQDWEVDGEQKAEEVYQEQNSEIRNNTIEAKIDYTNQLTNWLKLEAGYNGNYSHENSPTSTYIRNGEGLMVPEEDLWNRFIYNNNVTALYATLGGKYKAFSFSAGLRAEMWQIRAKSLSYGQTSDEIEPYKRNDFSMFPSAFVSWALPHDNELQVNYTRRIRRPWGGQLNSFRNISDPTNITYGNQELQPSYSNAFELNYIKSFRDHIISLSAYLRTSTDNINRISYIVEGIMYTTNANAGNQTDAGAEIVVKNNLFRNVLNLTTTANLYNNHVSAWNLDFPIGNGVTVPVSGKARNSFAWDIRCMAQVRLPWDMSFQATGRYNSKRLSAQGERGAGWSVDAGLRKSLGNWTFSLNCRDIFNSRKMHSYTYGVSSDGIAYSQEDKRWRSGRQLNLSIKYSFGNMRSKPNKNAMQQGEVMDGSGYGSEIME